MYLVLHDNGEEISLLRGCDLSLLPARDWRVFLSQITLTLGMVVGDLLIETRLRLHGIVGIVAWHCS